MSKSEDQKAKEAAEKAAAEQQAKEEAEKAEAAKKAEAEAEAKRKASEERDAEIEAARKVLADAEAARVTEANATRNGEKISDKEYRLPNGNVIKFPAYLRSSTEFQYNDSATNLVFTPHIPVKVEAAPATGSQLASNLDAGLVVAD